MIVESLNLESIKVPEPRRLPKRFSTDASTYKPKPATEYYRVEFYQELDVVFIRKIC